MDQEQTKTVPAVGSDAGLAGGSVVDGIVDALESHGWIGDTLSLGERKRVTRLIQIRLYGPMARTAANNTFSGLWCNTVLALMLVGVHQIGTHPAMERLLCAAIGVLWGWCLALWATGFILRYTRVTR